jgi:hypothetical protein
MGIGRRPETGGATAEYFCSGFKLGMNFKPDNRFEFHMLVLTSNCSEFNEFFFRPVSINSKVLRLKGCSENYSDHPSWSHKKSKIRLYRHSRESGNPVILPR